MIEKPGFLKKPGFWYASDNLKNLILMSRVRLKRRLQGCSRLFQTQLRDQVLDNGRIIAGISVEHGFFGVNHIQIVAQALFIA